MNIVEGTTGPFVIGGVDTHKDLHVAAAVDDHDRLLGSQSFATTRHGYKQMLAWMRSFGPVQRVGIEATGTYGAGLLRYLQKASVEVLEVTTPDKGDRPKRGKNDDFDAQNAAHAAFTGRRTVTPKSRDGMIEALRVLKACRKTAVAARRVALAAGSWEWISSTFRKVSGKRNLSHTEWLMISAEKRYPAKLGRAARAVIRPDYLVAGHSNKLAAGQVDCANYIRRL